MQSRRELSVLEKYLRGLEPEFLPEDTSKARLDYVDKHAAEIDLLVLYGAYPVYMPLVEHYKQIRPDGKIYLATDMNIAWADRLPHEHPQYKKFLHSCDVVAASCRATQKYLSTKWSVPVELIRNGWYNFFGVDFKEVFDRKENVILTVGRIGTNQKQNHVMLEAFAKVADKLPAWKLRLVGGIEKNFKPYVEKLTDNGRCGKVFPIGNVDALAKIFLDVCRDDKLISDGGRRAFDYAREQFDMNKIVARLNYLLYGGDGT